MYITSIYIYICFWAIPSYTQSLHLIPCSGLTLGGTQGNYMVLLGIKSVLAACKARTHCTIFLAIRILFKRTVTGQSNCKAVWGTCPAYSQLEVDPWHSPIWSAEHCLVC